MRWWLILAVLVSGLLAWPLWHVTPQDAATAGYTAAERARLESLIRSYVLDNGELLPEAMQRLERKQVSRLLASVRPELENPFHGAVGGNPKGDVTLVVFFDFRCPYCHQARRDIDALIKSDPGLRVVYHDFPVLDAPGTPPLSRVAASLALAAAKQNKYVAYHNALFDAPLPVTQESIVGAARKAGLDEARAVADSRSEEVAQAINRNLELGRLLNISGTPSYVLGGQVLIGGDKPKQLPALIAAMRSMR